MGSGLAPAEIRPWIKLFESSALYRHDTARLFEDWVEVMICCFANQKLEERYLHIIKGYTREELDTLSKLMSEFLGTLMAHTDGGGWYDMLGTIYEFMSGNYKRSGLGQFFTPECVCDMMAQMQEVRHHNSLIEPACGSGRMILAARRGKHLVLPPEGPWQPPGLTVAIDVDPICVKMTAVNLHLHGIRAEVACANALNPADWRFAYQTHPCYGYPFITYLGEEQKHLSLVWKNQSAWLAQIQEANAAPIVTVSPSNRTPDLFNQVSEPVPLYGEAARAKRYLDNERRQVLNTLKDIADVLERNKADEAFAANKKRIALELSLRGVELKGDTIGCYLGKTWCRFPYWNIKDTIHNAQEIYKHTA